MVSYRVVKRGLFCYSVMGCTRYQMHLIGHFWTRRGAAVVAANLNRFESEAGGILYDEDMYDRCLAALS